VRRQSGNSGSGVNERRREEPRLTGWAPRSRNPCSSPRPPLLLRQKRSENVLVSFICPFLITIFSWDRPGRIAKGSLQRRQRADSGGETVKMYAAIV
jgi:hypothetical protein